MKLECARLCIPRHLKADLSNFLDLLVWWMCTSCSPISFAVWEKNCRRSPKPRLRQCVIVIDFLSHSHTHTTHGRTHARTHSGSFRSLPLCSLFSLQPLTVTLLPSPSPSHPLYICVTLIPSLSPAPALSFSACSVSEAVREAVVSSHLWAHLSDTQSAHAHAHARTHAPQTLRKATMHEWEAAIIARWLAALFLFPAWDGLHVTVWSRLSSVHYAVFVFESYPKKDERVRVCVCVRSFVVPAMTDWCRVAVTMAGLGPERSIIHLLQLSPSIWLHSSMFALLLKRVGSFKLPERIDIAGVLVATLQRFQLFQQNSGWLLTRVTAQSRLNYNDLLRFVWG